MRRFLLVIAMMVVFAQVANAATFDADTREIILECGTRLRPTGEVRSYPLYEITEGHPLYDVVNQTIQRQFGVDGGVDGLAGAVTEWAIEEQERQARERRRNLFPLLLPPAVSVLLTIAVAVVCIVSRKKA
ncbi:MAG: hypothetical protein FWB96_04875 [Defluviitaleaceae bacterium]|nr:hypothetical protein [Defluviitaleaceae bacterium]MCL2262716.1 hypothetical protein [Defluviitaleaceae bacterium]